MRRIGGGDQGEVGVAKNRADVVGLIDDEDAGRGGIHVDSGGRAGSSGVGDDQLLRAGGDFKWHLDVELAAVDEVERRVLSGDTHRDAIQRSWQGGQTAETVECGGESGEVRTVN